MRRVTYGLAVVLIFMVPWEDSITLVTLGSLVRVVGLLCAGFWLITILLDGRFRKPHLFHVLTILFFLWNLVSVFWSPNTEATIQRMKTYSQIILIMLIYWEVFQEPENLKAGIQAFVFGAYVLITSTIYNFIRGNVAVEYEGRFSATGVNAVDLALILMIGLPIAMHLGFTAEQNKKGSLLKIVNFTYIPLAIFAIILTGSRTSLIAIIPFGFYLIGTRQIKFNHKVLIIGILFVSLLALLPFVPQSVTTRLGSLGASVEAKDLGGRVGLWLQSINILSKHPLLGLGSGALDSAIGSAAHNTFISVVTETGIIGLVFFIIILAIVFIQALSIPNENSKHWVAIYLIWIIGVFSLSWEFRKLTWLFLNFIIIASNFTSEHEHKIQSKIEIPKRNIYKLSVEDHGIK